MENFEPKRRLTLGNGLVVRGSYRSLNATRVAVELAVTDWHGLPVDTVRRTFESTDGSAAVTEAIEDLRKRLLACNINKFTGDGNMDIIRGVLRSVSRFYRSTASA